MPLNGAVISWTGYSPTLGTGAANIGATSGQLQFGNSPLPTRLENTLRRTQMRPFTRVWRQMTGAAVGATATVNRERVVAKQAYLDPSALGGLLQMELFSMINRATTAADQTYILSVIDKLTAPSPYVNDSSGNGGGGKLGF